METFFGSLSVVVAWIFVWAAWRQYRQRGQLHQLSWSIGALFFALGMTTELVATLQGTWSESGYRLWYFVGAMHGVSFFGQGTLFLFDRRPWVKRSFELLVILSIITGVVVLNASLDFSALTYPAEPAGRAFAGDMGWASPRLWTIPFNIYGSIWLIGGALYSTIVGWKRDRVRAVGTLCIALGGLVLASTSTLNRAGIVSLELVGRTLGINTLFAGFMLTGLPKNALPYLSIQSLVWPRIPLRAVFTWLGWLVALVLFLRLEPGVLAAFVAFPGLAVVALIFAGLVLAIFYKLRARRAARSRRWLQAQS